MQLSRNVAFCDAGKVISLATAEDGGKHLVLLRGGEDEHRIRWRLLQGLEEGIEGPGGEHVHLVYDEDTVMPRCRRHIHLFRQRAHFVDTVVGGGIQLYDIIRHTSLEVAAGIALSAGLAVGRSVLAVDGLGEDARTARLTHATRTAEQISLRQAA